MPATSNANDDPQVALARAGGGNWDAFTLPLDLVREAAAEWREALRGIDKPWLCWNVSADWCRLQQRLVRHVNWTPVVGFDPRAGAPPLEPGSVLIDFNRRFQLPVLKPMVPMEFAFLFADRLAFWHSDLLCRLSTMEYLAGIYDSLRPGEMAAVLDRGGWQKLLSTREHRYWELAGCTTREASEDQFTRGSGWWRHIECHPNCPSEEERERRRGYHWEHGIGIMYWKRFYGGVVQEVKRDRVEEGHCTSFRHPNYQHQAPRQYVRNLTADLDANYDLQRVAGDLGISHLL